MAVGQSCRLSTPKSKFARHRFPPEVIKHAVWLYHRFSLSFRDVEDLLAERGVIVSYETIRRWCLKFGPRFQRAVRRREGRLGDHWFCDEVFISINSRTHCVISYCAKSRSTVMRRFDGNTLGCRRVFPDNRADHPQRNRCGWVQLSDC